MADAGSRRRLVQSTLFGQMDSSVKRNQRSDGDRVQEVEDEDEEYSVPGKKQSRGTRRNNSKPKARERACSRKVTENGEGTSSKQIHDSDSPAFAKSAFFLKCSEKKQLNQPIFRESPEQNDETCSPLSSTSSTPQKLKRRNKTSPNKEMKHSTPSKKLKSGQRGSYCGQIPFDLEVDGQAPQILPNLRLEAKLTAEENSRMFAGRQIHPFFASRKLGKKNQDSTCLQSKRPSVGMEKGTLFNPIHVFDNTEEDHGTPDWGHWILSARTCTDTLEYGCSAIYEGSVKTINFDNLSVAQIQTSSCQSPKQFPNQHNDISQELIGIVESSNPFSSLSLGDMKNSLHQQCKDTEMLPEDADNNLNSAQAIPLDQGLVKNDPFVENSRERTLGSTLREKLLHERIMSQYDTSANEPENRLWTDKYQPQNAKQVCGNDESVRILSEWLQLWHQKGSLTTTSYIVGEKLRLEDLDGDYQLTDSDSDTDEESLKNVLLVTGPVGSGKSAAIYTCAREQGFQVIEINASDWRNGSIIKQKFGEAVESHWRRRTVEDAPISDGTPMSKFFKGASSETCCSNNDVIDLTNKSEDSVDATPFKEVSCSANAKSSSHQGEVKTVILFEDIDAVLCEDHGFINTIQQLAQTAKRPMILTSNCDDPLLPKNMDRLKLSFSAPSVEELFGLLLVICNAEKAEVTLHILERFVDYCQRDIRKAITHLQFWCQGCTFGRDRKIPATTYWPVLFDPNAAHSILPRAIHWVYPSQLSQVVSGEIVKSLTLMEESSGFVVSTNQGKDVNDFRAEVIGTQESECDRIELKKEAMLSLQCLHDDRGIAGDDQIFNFSCSPVALPPRSGRRMVNTVLSSDSEDEVSDGNPSLVPASEMVGIELPDLSEIPTSQNCLSDEMHLQSIEPIYQADVGNLEDEHLHPVEIDYSQLEDTCISHDPSFVPESSFVAETEIINESQLHSVTISSGHLEKQDSIQHILATKFGETLFRLQNEESLGSVRNRSTACVSIEEVGDSVSRSNFDVQVGYQAMDECSRVDFMTRFDSLSNPKSNQFIDYVQETWEKLKKDQSKDLRKHVTSEEKTVCQLLTHAHGISDVISEVDLLLKDCQPLMSEFLEPSSFPTENTLSHSYYDDQVSMTSIFGQHGICLYAKEMSKMGCTSSFDWASEMLSASTSSIALGKLIGQGKRIATRVDKEAYTSSHLLGRKLKSPLRDILQSVVPPKSYMAANGDAFHEYMSALGLISRYESSRLSECLNIKKQRRSRVSRHYLSSGSLTMSQEEISLLDRHITYQR